MKFTHAALTGLSLYAMAVGQVVLARSLQDKPKTTWDGVYTEEQAKRGADLYAKACASCHAPDLSGMDTAPSLTGSEFNAGWNDLALDDLFERIRTTMPADGPGSLQRPEYTDIVAFILSKDGFPAGPSELSSENGALKAIKFVAQKP